MSFAFDDNSVDVCINQTGLLNQELSRSFFSSQHEHWLGRLTKSTQFRRDHRVVLRQLSHQWPPHMTVLGIAVQQNYRVAFPGNQIVKLDSANGCEAVLNRGP